MNKWKPWPSSLYEIYVTIVECKSIHANTVNKNVHSRLLGFKVFRSSMYPTPWLFSYPRFLFLLKWTVLDISYGDPYQIRLFLQLTSASHFSTSPPDFAGMTLFEKWTTSSSADTMAIISLVRVKSNLAIPSKHFFRWGCTRRGSFVSERISRSSSLDKKKNLSWKSKDKNNF